MFNASAWPKFPHMFSYARRSTPGSMFSIPTLQFAALSAVPGLRHAVATRTGGVSPAPHDSLNLGYHVGDDAAHVSENRRRLADTLGYDANALVAAQQMHGARAHIVDASCRGRGALDWEAAIPGTDALLVREAATPVLILVADCAPLLLADARQRALAVVHAGWRGAVAGIASQTVKRTQQEFDSRPEDIRAGIGPCLCASCFEIGDEVAQAARAISAEAVINGAAKPHLDLRALLRSDLQDAGVSPQHIEAMPHCPRCDTATWFSHRGENGRTGRFGLVAWWE